MAINTYDESFLDVLKKNIGLVITTVLIISLVIIGFFGIRFYLDRNSGPSGSVDGSGLIRDFNFTIGNKDSKLKLIYALDLQCPACRQNNDPINGAKAELKDKVLFVYKNYPLPIHTQAKTAAYAAMAAGEQGKYFEYIDQIYALQDQLKTSLYEDMAKTVGLDLEKWNNRRNSTELRDFIETDLEDLKNINLPKSSFTDGNKVSSTPTTILVKDDKIVEWWSGVLTKEEMVNRINKFL